MTTSVHMPVLVPEVIEGLSPRPGDVVVDGTVGGGGHAAAITRALSGDVRLFCFDLDTSAIEAARETVAEASPRDVRFFEASFRDASSVLAAAGIEHIDRAILDLGLRSDQLESGGRGFSFLRDEPLLMTFSSKACPDDFTARDIVNGWSAEDIANVLSGYGGERYARRIARGIVLAREASPIETTGALVAVIERSVPPVYRRGRIHPATKTFQALRIAVNDEMGALSAGMTGLFDLLLPGGRLAVISFHSLEDGTVKRFMRERVREGAGRAVTKKPIVSGDAERRANPRSRSAKLRVIERVALMSVVGE